MKDQDKTKAQLLSELAELRQRVTKLETAEAERKRAEEALRIKENAIASAINGMAIGEFGGSLTFVNRSFLRLWGYEDETEVLGKPAVDFWQSNEQAAQIIDALSKSDSWVGELAAKRKDGSSFDVQIAANVVRDQAGHPICMMGSFLDITERKRAEQALKESEEKFRSLAEQSPNMVFINKHGKVLYANKRCEEIMGHTREEFYSADFDFRVITASECVDLVETKYAQHMRGEEVEPYEYALIAKDGKRIEAISATRLIDYGGQSAILGIITDITARKRAEEALRASEQRFRQLVESSTDYIYTVRIEAGRPVSTTHGPSCIAVTGYTPEEYAADPHLWYRMVYEQDRLAVTEQAAKVLSGETALPLEHRLIHKDGSIRWVRNTPVPRHDDQGRLVAYDGLIVDITGRKRAEEKLQRDAREMEALYQTSLEINAQPDMPTLLRTIVERATGLLNVLMGGLQLMKPDGGTMEMAISYNLPEEYVGATPHLGEGVAGRVAQTGEPLMVEDYFAWEGRAKAFIDPRFRRVLGVPLKVGSRILGVIMLTDDKPGAFGENEIRLASLFADQAAIALENARLYKAEQEQREFAETLREVSAVLVSTLDADAVLDRILDQIGRVVPHDAAILMLIELGVARIEKYRGDAEHGLGDLILGFHFQVADVSNLHYMLDTGQPIVILDVEAYPGWVDVPGTNWIRSHLGAPLRVKGQVIGFLNLYSAIAGFFTETHAERLQAFADQAALALENARLFEEARRRLDEMAVVSNVALVGAAGRPFDETVAHATQALSRLWPDAALGFLFLDKTDGALRPHSSYYGLTPEALASLRLSVGQGITGRVVRERQPIRVGDVTIDPHYISFVPGIQSEMAAPLVVSGHVLGVVNVESPHLDAFSDDDLRLLTTLAGQLALIFEKARLDAAVAKHTTLLEQRVQERTAELSAANVELARASRMKDEFLAAMTHELRTPLTAVLGMSGALREQTYGPLNEKQLKSVQAIEESGQRLLELINNILDLSRLMADKVELQIEPVRAQEICQMSLQSIQRAAREKKLDMSLKVDDDAETVIQADGRRLRQVLVNLLSNAVKFTPEGGAIGLEVVKDKQKPLVHLTVWDTGIGIAPEDIGRLFQPFGQLDTKLSRRYSGTGLGLTLVEWLVRLHGGHVTVESVVGQGSRFTVSLPSLTSPPDVMI
jgi:PAS domain S-box-containing protein